MRAAADCLWLALALALACIPRRRRPCALPARGRLSLRPRIGARRIGPAAPPGPAEAAMTRVLRRAHHRPSSPVTTTTRPTLGPTEAPASQEI